MRGDIKATRRSRCLSGPALLRLISVYAVALFLVVLAGIIVLAAWRMYGRMVRAGEEAAAARSQLVQIQRQRAAVAENLKKLSTSQGREAELRARYGVARPGEGVIQIVEAASDTGTIEQNTEGFFERIWRALVPW